MAPLFAGLMLVVFVGWFFVKLCNIRNALAKFSHQTRQLLKTLIALLAFGMASAWGNVEEILENNNEDVSVRICFLATYGVYTIASEHQAGRPKEVTKSVLDGELKRLPLFFSNRHFVSGIGYAWQRALDDIYKLPVQSKQDDKERFISQMTEAAFVSCLDNIEMLNKTKLSS